jgi:hypothetical protein
MVQLAHCLVVSNCRVVSYTWRNDESVLGYGADLPINLQTGLPEWLPRLLPNFGLLFFLLLHRRVLIQPKLGPRNVEAND